MTFEELKEKINKRFQPKNEAERQKLIKYAVIFPAMFIIFIVAMWLIFGDGFSSGSTDTSKANMELPEGDNEEIEGNKLKAMEQKKIEDEKNRRDSVVQTYIVQSDTLPIVPTTDKPDPIQSSAEAYQAAQATLEDFYIPDQTSEVAALQERIAELEAEKSQSNYNQQAPNEKELMEESYRLAAQYMGIGNGQAPPTQQEEKGKRNVQPVQTVAKKVVSTLSAATNDRGFATAVGSSRSVSKNTIAAEVAGDQSITNGQAVKFRTVEPMWIGNHLIPRNTTIVGEARLQGERLGVEITSIETNGSIYEVELQVFDSDGQEGINIPNSMESDALHEIGANMGSTMGSSINISTDAGAQIASDVGRGLINGVSQYLTKKMRTVKVHLKAGYKVMLHQPEDK